MKSYLEKIAPNVADEKTAEMKVAFSVKVAPLNHASPLNLAQKKSACWNSAWTNITSFLKLASEKSASEKFVELKSACWNFVVKGGWIQHSFTEIIWLRQGHFTMNREDIYVNSLADFFYILAFIFTS